jgi:LmbE family N-acetylglucosaminyl deacetylase
VTAVDPIAGPGTDEAAWRAWGLADRIPELQLPVGPVTVVVAHPDDETLALGGTMARLAAEGSPLTLVVATDGEGSHPDSAAVTPEQLRVRRREEQTEALRRLGLGAAGGDGAAVEVIRWQLPDGGLGSRRDAMAERLVPRLVDAATVLTLWRDDAHPDHEAVADAVVRAADHLDVPVLEAPLWAWHWASPGDARVPWDRAARIDLDEPVLAAKRHAVAAYSSQVQPLGPLAEDGPVVPPDVLAHLVRPFEVVLR